MDHAGLFAIGEGFIYQLAERTRLVVKFCGGDRATFETRKDEAKDTPTDPR
ncbi:hypothetical protein GGR26_000422 [Lewinella marina]|uniref:hypothetical protein n=1 Tax=Neolewinella marina TaxID=438751 RepID=UPI001430B754|nr:hypothetical protein [Neolewinella marina]NJB84677.1 hypothetical protein [Neolewinella marina]